MKQIQHYSLQAELGQGMYSKVFKAIHNTTKQEVAIKMVQLKRFKQIPKLQKGAINEINTLTSLKPCRNIIKYLDMMKSTNYFYFVYEYCNGGTLQNVLKKVNYLTQKQSLLNFKQLTNGFKILVQGNIMHRDIKPQNILIHNGMLKIADFGFCKPLEHQDGMAETMLGSPIYMAPQVLKGQPYTMKADIWSLGIVLFRMLFGFCPFQSNNIAKLILILNQQQLKIPQSIKISPILQELLKKMLTKDPKKRAQWHQIFSYEITWNGQILYPKLKNSGASNKASTTGSSIQSINSPNIKQQIQQNLQKIKKIQSPKNNQPNLNKTTNIVLQSLRESLKSKSPLRSTITPKRNQKKQILIKNHKKCVQLSSMAIEVGTYECSFSPVISYFLCKVTQKQLLLIQQSLIKNGLPINNQNIQMNIDECFLIDLNNMIIQQLKNITQIINLLQTVLTEINISCQDVIQNRKKYLKKFIQGTNMNNKQQLSLCHQLIDFIFQDILINKKTYYNLRQEQMKKKIVDKIKQIN